MPYPFSCKKAPCTPKTNSRCNFSHPLPQKHDTNLLVALIPNVGENKRIFFGKIVDKLF